MKLVKKVKKHVARHAKKARKAIAKAASSVRNRFDWGMSPRATVGYLALTVVLAAALSFEVDHLRHKNYVEGCVDGAAASMATLIPFAAKQIVTNRNDEFSEMCGYLGELHVKGKSLDSLIQ